MLLAAFFGRRQLLPTEDPLAVLVDLVSGLSEQEIGFLEGGTETYLAAGRAFSRPPLRAGAWAASLAVAMRPQLFALGAAASFALSLHDLDLMGDL